MEKQIIYAPIPEFDQQTQYVAQLLPEEREDCIYYGVEVRQMEMADEDFEM